ncbi:hypothetical protein E4625_09760 [Aeromonas hydrophila]|uniref:hypothetical protein n=1 Tax=Aeromonas hydrophila TaxID=644 RepID=UPI000FD180C4|nr:hypothetical protein [Aeromonas hydrophila]AZU48372.1 hypothetical protein C3B79_2614 [Aeromonas hydrophila]QBX71097.1 hypothetical protein E4625_09760 [Aeromonas hydrophila]
MIHIDKLVKESIDVDGGRDELIAVAKKTSQKIYKKLVCEQATTQPIATVYGVKQKVGDKDPFIKHVWNNVPAQKLTQSSSFVPGDKITDDTGLVVVALDFIQSDITGAQVMSSCYSLVLSGKAIVLNDLPQQAEIQDSTMEISRWRAHVGSKTIKMSPTIEMLQDLDKQGVNSQALVYDVISNVISEGVNSEIIIKLIGISQKELDFSLINYETSYYRGRELIARIGEMVGDIKKNNAKPSFVICTPRVEAVIKSSGQVKGEIIDGLNLEILCDTKTPIDYVLVGCASDNRLEPSSLYYSPMITDDELSMLFTSEVENLQPSYAVNVRYALTTSNMETVDGGKVVDTDWVSLANKSVYTKMAKVVL